MLVQVQEHGWRLDADAFRAVVEERPAVRRPMLRHAQYYIGQLARSVACNRPHTLEERCARWLLMTHDRVPGGLERASCGCHHITRTALARLAAG